MEILRVENLKKNFNGAEALKGVGFTLEKGEILVIIGGSGSGKTTLLRCLNLLERADGGKIYFSGEELYSAGGKYSEKEIRAMRRKFGLVFQNFNLFPNMNALSNVRLAADLLSGERAAEYRKELMRSGEKRSRASALAREYKRRLLAENEDRALKLLEQVGLSDKKNSYPCELSGGQQQRVAIARALAMDPEILCFDEPTSALDPELTGEVLKVIRGLKGRTMIIVTHEMKFAREAGDKAIFMSNGEIVEEGGCKDIFDCPRTDKLKAFLKKAEE